MSGDSSTGMARTVVRLALDRDFGDDAAETRIHECGLRDCEVSFLGMTAEDYGVHLIENHSICRGSQRKLYNALARGINRSLSTENDQS